MDPNDLAEELARNNGWALPDAVVVVGDVGRAGWGPLPDVVSAAALDALCDQLAQSWRHEYRAVLVDWLAGIGVTTEGA